MVNRSTVSDFGFKIDFDRNAEDPARIFRALSKLIIFCETTDQMLIDNLDLQLQSKLILDHIEQGSIIVWLKFLIDTEQAFHKALKAYLVKIKQLIINFTKNRSTINNSSELKYLQNEIQKITEENPLNIPNRLNIAPTPTEKDLLESIDKLSTATSELEDTDKLFYLMRDNKSEPLPINCEFHLNSEAKKDLLTQETKESQTTMILQVKKPDYLGDSKWHFKHGKFKLEAKINDLDWLNSFRNREVAIYAGDSLNVIVKIITKYDSKGQVIFEQHSIEKVIEVIPAPRQQSLFDQS